MNVPIETVQSLAAVLFDASAALSRMGVELDMLMPEGQQATAPKQPARVDSGEGAVVFDLAAYRRQAYGGAA